ncbi:PREDICTED: uncharacterized protein LOC109580733 [Amphimedon queenslandica]|nr:PREDICTED: uncharacterized protein LOC109580733 [Amphimedon queenslandica]|eukprot:XP_019849792.1 PREDICTED: uncharacterized protein LOC109580733 [Amphimedon queenslandica]
MRVQKTDDDNIPLADPFPLPKRYRPEVEKALKEGKMRMSTRSLFLSAVASAIFACKMYSTREDYNCVGCTIVNKYPFLRAPSGAGSPHAAIVVQLINHFKEFRREKSHNTLPDATSSKRKQTDVAKKQPGDYLVIFSVKIEEGEDEFFFQQHQKRWKAEHKKCQPNDSLVDDLMTRSFGMQRKD